MRTVVVSVDSFQGNLAVRVEGLVVSYGSKVAVDGLSFQVGKGEVYGLLGPNGAGKTSTIRVLTGIMEPQAGRAEVLGRQLSDEVALKSQIGYVPENATLLDSLTPREFLEFVASVRGMKGDVANAKVGQLVAAFGLAEYFDNAIATLSLGTKQKVSIIAALMHDPTLLILDEPLNGLDTRSSRIVKELIKHHAEKGGAVIFCTHIMEVAENICTRVGIINRGKLVGEGTVSQLRELVRGGEASLEDIFLKVTEQEAGIRDTIKALEGI
jgi:ABC-2 type transport system ATP-binding protein